MGLIKPDDSVVEPPDPKPCSSLAECGALVDHNPDKRFHSATLTWFDFQPE